MRSFARFILFLSVVWAFSAGRAAEPSIKICVIKLPGSALPVIAKELDFFSAEGLSVELQPEDLGLVCMERLKRGEVDYAVAFTTPVVRSINEKPNLRVITELHSSTRGGRILYAADSAIRAPSDLENHKVAIVRGTDSEYIFELFALAHDFKKTKVKFVDSRPEQLVDRLVSGEVDAAVLWSPFIEMAQARSQRQLRVFDSSFFTEFSLLTTSQKEIADGRAQKVLRALTMAQDYLVKHPVQARALIKKWVGWRQEVPFDQIWSRSRIEVRLSAVFKTMFVQQLRFLRGRPLQTLNSADLTKQAESWIDQNPLKLVAPAQVTM